MLAGGIFIAQTFFTLGRLYDCKFSKFTFDSYWSAFPLLFAIFLFPMISVISLTNIAMISLQQAHTKFRPFKHRVIKKWVSGVAIVVFWVLAAIVSACIVRVLSYFH